MKAEIIAVGSELLLGQIANTNAQFLSQQLAELGIDVYYHTVVGDNPVRLAQAIEIAQKRSNLLIFTGGLGPTKDDLTKETIAKMLNKKLVIDEEAWCSICDYFAKTKRTMTANNRKQALVLEGAYVLKNEHGMAPGMALTVGEMTYMLLPGPPKEMQPMFLKYGRPFLLQTLDVQEKIESLVLRFFHIGESQLEAEIEDFIDAQTNPTIAPLAADGEVTLRITAKHRVEEEAKKMIRELEKKILTRVGDYFYGYNGDTLFSKTLEKLKEKGKTIAIAESLTGGLFAEQLTAISGASAVVKGGVICYTNEIKENVLGVPKEILQTEGAVSKRCAQLLAENVRKLCRAHIGISFTGVAGPSELEGKPVGTVWIGIATEEETKTFPLTLAGNRDMIRMRTAKYGCYYLLQALK
ncbi:nicotinamide-nucleotide amidase [Thermolongibacillus altinsuensis]|uniref:Putative competence-damage inducible protein n=1 Tax=Thermolongibacillus altinsuensis TaxID=575256 RepID=A0A4R1QAC2_9BACL|nr:competence/damage-inducible protein A [Thermolongibacillus altinsuensis]TCL45678.1 nicotinamide-nucleotide amidase [Thermolongibacillus altinsuensis]GMB08386.1 putative competence-damage inducible protein [Thermolongibacillus altinsuensis]